MMTRKDYELIAGAINDAKPHHFPPSVGNNCCLCTWTTTISMLSRRIADANPNFDIGRFKRRCHETVKEPS